MVQDRVTSLDVAHRAGVSRSAVSRVFTPGASASSKTVEKVRRAANELGYRPNVIARAMVSGRSRIIGLIVAYLDNQFYPDALEKLSNALQEQGYHALIFMANTATDNIDDVLEEILDYQVDGVVAASVALSTELMDRCKSAGIPVVMFNRTQEGSEHSEVVSDNIGGGAKVAEFLIAGGHKKIGYIAGWQGASTQRDRELGFTAALEQAGQKTFARQVGNFHLETAKDAARKMFDAEDRPDAVFVANDHMAFAVMDVLRFELGLSVPGDVSVVGFDDVPTSAWAAYDLTTIRQQANKMVSQTVATLMNEIDGQQTGASKIAIDSPLVVRSSARIPEGWKR